MTGDEQGTRDTTTGEATRSSGSAQDTDSAPEGAVAPDKVTPPRAASAATRARRIGGRVSPTATAPAETTADPASLQDITDEDEALAARRSSLRKRAATSSSAAGSPEAPEPEPRARSRSRSRRTLTLPSWLAWVPAAVFLAMAVVFVVLLVVDKVGNSSSGPTTSKERETVLAAAKNCVAATNTYKYTSVDTYEQAGLKCATGVYAKQYRSAMETLIKKNAPAQKFTQIAQVNSAGVESVTDNGKQWSALIYGQLNITNTVTGKNGRIDPFALVVRMEQVKSKWVISGVKLLSTPAK